jgi:hypothetical protein
MRKTELRLDIPTDLYKEYKILCIQKDLSIPKQTAALIKNFVDIQKENEKRLRNE